MKKLYSGNIYIEYGQFYIDLQELDDGDDDNDDNYIDPIAAFEAHENGICGSAQSGKSFL